MPIVETKIVTRPSTNIEFFNETNNSARVAATTGLTPLLDQGRYTITKSLSSDELTQTTTRTFDTVETYSQYETIVDINLEFEARQYTQLHNFVYSAESYSQSGIDQPFSCITTYTYNSDTVNNYPLFNTFINAIESSKKLVDLTNNGSVVTAVHNYENSEDFTQNHWSDFEFIEGLHSADVARTITYTIL